MSMDIPKVDERFSKHLLFEDELGAVVRAHIHIEASLREFVDVKMKSPSPLPRLTYEARLRLAVALGFNEKHFESLKFLGDIRNAFSHNLETKLTDESMTELYSKMPSEMQQSVLTHFTEVVASRPGMPSVYSAMSPKNRFVLMMAVPKGTVVGLAHAAKIHAA
jgi:hypothetical protein